MSYFSIAEIKHCGQETYRRKFLLRLRVPEDSKSLTVGTVAAGGGRRCRDMKAPS